MSPLDCVATALAVAVVLTGAAALACDSDGGSAPTPSPTRSASSIDIGPYPQPTALANPTGTETYILDVPSGDIFLLRGAWPGLRWVDDNLLATDLGTRIDLDQQQHIIGDFDDPPTLPIGRALTSPDGRWDLNLSNAIDTVVNADGSVVIEIPRAERQGAARDGSTPQPQFAWSPAGSLLAIGGGRCGESPLHLIDPDAGTILPLSDPDTRAMDYAWTPDGSAIAISILDPDTNAQLVRYDVTDQTETLLAPMPPTIIAREMIALAWNPSATRLLFTIYTHRPCPS